MPKFTFICEDDPMPFSTGVLTKRTIEFDAVQINDVVSEFELFLRGAGFNPPGILDFVQDDAYYADLSSDSVELQESDWNASQDDIPDFPITDKSPYYFDPERNK